MLRIMVFIMYYIEKANVIKLKVFNKSRIVFYCFFFRNRNVIFRESLIFSINTEAHNKHKFYEDGSVEVVKVMDCDGNTYVNIIINWLEF